VTDELLLHLPPSLHTLNVSYCDALTERASFVHLMALATLDCCGTSVGVAGLPPSLQELVTNSLPAGASLAHLACLRVLRANKANFNASTLASLPPTLLELHAAECENLAPGASFAHLSALHTLDVSGTTIDDASLASLPPSLVSLIASRCWKLTPAAVMPPLPALRLLDVSGADIEDALVASLPAGLAELRMSRCEGVTAGATLDHLPELHTLHSYGTDLAPAELDSCRARGCAVLAAGVLRGHRGEICALALLADGRLASGHMNGEVWVWNVTAGGGEAGVILPAANGVFALAALRDGCQLAVGLFCAGVEIWDVEVVPPVRRVTIYCNGSWVQALAVLRDGRLATGCGNKTVQIIDVDAGAVVATLKGHSGSVTALAVLPDGALSSGSRDGTVRLWDVDAQVCVATLAGHFTGICALAVLADGRLAGGLGDGTVRLWDVGSRACVGELTGHTANVSALAALPDGRLISGSWNGTIRVWDTRPTTAAAGSHAAGVVPMVAFAHGLHKLSVLVPLPDGRLACARGAGDGAVYLLHVPPPVAYE